MTNELTKLREALRRVKYEAASLADAQVIALEALTQRPAAQEVSSEAQELAHNMLLWREDARMHGSEYVPVHVHTLDKLIEQLRGLPAPQQATPETAGDRCAQCKKAYRQGAGVDGCPKCAPGVRVSEAEFQQPIHTPATPEPVGEHKDGWLQEGGLLYRLTDGRRPENRDEINVTMADGSRTPEARARRAGELLDRIRNTRPAAAPAGMVLVPMTEDQRKQVFRDAENRMVRDINLSWRNAVIDCVEDHHTAALAAAQAKGTPHA